MPSAVSTIAAPVRRSTRRRVEPERPTIEDLLALAERVKSEEALAFQRARADSDATIRDIKPQLAEADGATLDALFAELQQAVRGRELSIGEARRRAFAAVRADVTFAPRRFLRAIDPEPGIDARAIELFEKPRCACASQPAAPA